MNDDDTVWDDDGMPHSPFDSDIDGVPYAYPTCGQDGEWWPCPEKARATTE